jgi:isochorismate synthase EntC
MRNGRLQQNNYASSSKQAKDRYEHLFVVQHMLNTMYPQMYPQMLIMYGMWIREPLTT